MPAASNTYHSHVDQLSVCSRLVHSGGAQGQEYQHRGGQHGRCAVDQSLCSTVVVMPFVYVATRFRFWDAPLGPP